jgi:hypothetical protein
MNGETLPREGWSKIRWRVVIGGLLLLQVGLIFLLGARQLPAPRSPEDVPLIRTVSNEPFLRLNDPTIFSLPSPFGFSGPAWLHGPSFEYAMTNWTEAPEWLDLEIHSLGDLKMESPPSGAVADPSEFMARSLLLEPKLMGPSEVPGSFLKVEGELKNRLPKNLPVLPTQVAADVLRPTIIDARVDADGRVVGATIWSGSDSKPADLAALKIAKGLIFNPIPRSTSQSGASATETWGRLIFQWLTTDLPK